MVKPHGWVDWSTMEHVPCAKCQVKKTFWLVVSTPLKNMKVNWDDDTQYMGIIQMFQTTNQLGLVPNICQHSIHCLPLKTIATLFLWENMMTLCKISGCPIFRQSHISKWVTERELVWMEKGEVIVCSVIQSTINHLGTTKVPETGLWIVSKYSYTCICV